MARVPNPARGVVLGVVLAGAAAASLAVAGPAVARPAPMATVSGPVRSVDHAHRTVTLQAAQGAVTVALAAGGRVQVHGLAAGLNAVHVGMMAFAEGSPAGVGRVAAKLVQGLALIRQRSILTGTVSTVDAAGATLVVEPGPYLRAVVFVPSGSALRRDGKPMALGSVRAGAVVTVHGFQDVQDPSEIVATAASFQSAEFTPDLRGSIARVDASHQLLAVRTASGKVVTVSVPPTTPVLAGGQAFSLDGLQPGTGVSVAYTRDGRGQIPRTTGGVAIARIVADDRSAY